MTRLADALVADLSIAADTGEIRRASAWLARAGSEWRVPADPLWRLELCVNEALANAIGHGGARVLSNKIHLRLEVRRRPGSAEAQVTISDGGAAFDPLGGAARPSPRTLEEAVPGGLGVPLLRHLSDRLSYRRDEGRNHLTFSVCWEETP
jgi:anti-sigma regulatory factor (Ser/Thr protein kinase)